MVQTLESDIERYLVHKVKQGGGLCYKWVSPGNAGVPDRIVITIRGVYFIELKRSEKHHPRALQMYYLSQIKKQGANVLVIHSKTQVDEFIKGAF